MKVILFGATGMVGSGLLIECLADPAIESVLCIGRKPSGFTHPKVRDLVHANLRDFSGLRNELRGFDACFFALGISSVGLDEPTYRAITLDIPVAAATVLADVNPGMPFCFVSGAGADSSEQGRVMWARVKGAAENRLLAMHLKTWVFRPGLIQPRKGVTSRTGWYNVFYAITAPLYPLLLRFAGAYVTATDAVGRAMINVAKTGFSKRILESRDINEAAKLR